MRNKNKKFDLGLFRQRNADKVKCKDQCKQLMEENKEQFCGDKIHALAVYMIYKEYGVELTPEIIQRLATIDRAKRQVQTDNPHLKLSNKTDAYESNDRAFYGAK